MQPIPLRFLKRETELYTLCGEAQRWICAEQGVKKFDPRSPPDSHVTLLMVIVTASLSVPSFPSCLLTAAIFSQGF